MTPSELIARAVQRERHRAGISLSALAESAGLAKSTLSQLEAGKGNPSIETLWAIASALQVPFSHLFENPAPEKTLTRADEGIELSAEESAYTTVLLADCPPGRRRDLFKVRILAGPVRRADAHPAGTIEHVFLSSGKLRVGPRGDTEVLHPGDYFRYPGDVPHEYEALSPVAVMTLVMEN